MAEIRCPMCGKPNPDDLDVCQFCEARLKPLIAPPSEEQPPIPEEEIPSQPDPTPDAPQEDPDLPDWLRSIRQEGGVADDEELERGAEEDKFDAEAFDWLERIQEDEEAPPPEEMRPPFEEEVMPSSQFDQEEQPEEGEQPFEAVTPDEGLPDWLESEEETAPSSQFDQQEKPEEGEQPFEAVTPDEGLPDWLESEEETAPSSEFDQEGKPEEDEQPFEAVTPEEGLPDWLESEEETAPSSQFDQQEQPEEGLPEWLDSEEETAPSSEFDQEEQPEEEEQFLEAVPPEEELPDWLSDLGGVEQDTPSEETPFEEATPAEELPAWMSQFSEEEAEPPPPLRATEEEHPSPREEAKDLPEWLEEMEASVPEVVSEEEAPPPAEEKEEISTFLTDEGVEFEGEAPLDEELPEWISASQGEESEEEPPEVEQEPEIERGDLPAWLAAMLPTEVEVPEEEQEDKVEVAGPLVGLRDTLSAEPEIARVKRPPAYSIKLNVTEKQGRHAKLWERILSAEGEPESIPQPPILSTQQFLRWLIALVLLIVVAGIIVADSQFVAFPDPALIPSEVLDASRLITGLPTEAPVLLAFDYEPGLTGEMDATAAAIVDHLMLKGTRLALISTSPTGPVVAERFINQVQSEHGYVSGGHYINLGYVPGGISGLLSLAQIPQRVTPLSFDGLDAWGTRPLRGITTLDDFSLAVVITDNPDTARAWVEQVQPKLGDTPLVMVVSAQAEPLVRPYLENSPPQIDGLVSSLIGGAAYEEMTGRSGLVRRYWDAFSAGLLIAVIAILVGGVYNLAKTALVGLREEDKTRGEGK